MPGVTGAGWILAGFAWLAVAFGPAEAAGFPRAEIAAALAFGGVAFLLTGWAIDRSRTASVSAVLVLWALAAFGLSGLYLNRGNALAVARQWSDEWAVSPLGGGAGEVSVAAGGEVSVARRRDGYFAIPARIRDHEVPFIFDTGASTVVLTAATAERLGYPADALTFRVPVMTANGQALAAPVTLDEIRVGSITARRVPALVVRAGLLGGNLLGQTFLDRLESYEVRGSRLVLRAHKA